MKNINVVYDRSGKIQSVSDTSMYFEQENDALRIDAQIPVDDGKLVRAYIRASKNSDVVDVQMTAEDVYSLTVGSECMSKGTMYVGFEVYDESGYVERYEPLKVYIDGFINPGNSSSENVYVVTVDVAETETLESDTPAYVENVGTQKDMRLKIGVPRGKDGEPGYTPVKGKDYFTADEQQSFKEDVLGDVETKVFDYYYTFNSMVENYNEYTEPGIYKIKHVLGMHSKVVLMLVRRFSTGVFQLRFSPNQITSRTGNVGEDGKITWEEWGKFARESYVEDKIDQSLETAKVFDNQVLVDSKAYTDEKAEQVKNDKTFNVFYLTGSKTTNVTSVTFNETGQKYEFADLYSRNKLNSVNNTIAGMQQRINGIDYDHNQLLADSKAYTDEKFQEVDIYGVHARLDAFNDAFNQYDISLNDITNTLGDIDTAMDMKVIADITTTEDVANVYITKDIDGNPINQYKDYFLLMQTRQTNDGALTVAVKLNDGSVYMAYQKILSSKPEWKQTWYMRSTYIGYFGEVSTSDAFSGSQYARITEFPSTAVGGLSNQGLSPTHKEEIVNYSSRNVSYDKVNNFIISAVNGQSFERGSRFILLGRKAI